MKIFSSKKRAAAIGAVTAATLLGGTVAFAYWTTTGSGTGTATTGTSSALTIQLTPSPSVVALKPGTGVQGYSVSVTNPASNGVQYLTSMDVVVDPLWVVAGPTDDCTAADFSVSAVTGLPASINPGTTWSGSVSVSMENLNEPQDACKSLTAAVPLIATAS